MYKVKIYNGNYDKVEFYSIMGKFFAEKDYKKIMPYLSNDNDKIWYLFFDNKELAGFCGIKITSNYVNFMDIYSEEKYVKLDILNFMCNKIFEDYKQHNIRVVTSNDEEIKIWIKFGFELSGAKGKYKNLIWENKNEQN